jgi:hypothetical protein
VTEDGVLLLLVVKEEASARALRGLIPQPSSRTETGGGRNERGDVEDIQDAKRGVMAQRTS